MSKVVSIRLKDEQFERLQRVARRTGRTPSASAALMLEEALRQREFPYIEFRDTADGRQAYLKGTRLPIWRIVSIARGYDGDLAKTMEHLGLAEYQIRAALDYAAAHVAEIEAEIEDSYVPLEELKRLIPGIRVFTVRDDDEDPSQLIREDPS